MNLTAFGGWTLGFLLPKSPQNKTPTKQNCHRWAQVTRFVVIVDKELNLTHRVYSRMRERTDLLSDSTLHRTWEQANSQQRFTSGAGGILFLQGGYFLAGLGRLLLLMYKYSYYFKAIAHVVSLTGHRRSGHTMLPNGPSLLLGSPCTRFALPSAREL